MTGWVGVDPGAVETGVVARDGSRLVAARLVDRRRVEPDADEPGPATMTEVADVVEEFLELLGAGVDRVVVERAARPNPHLGLIDVGALLAAREVIGFVRCRFPWSVLVAPARHGRRPLSSYPRDLVSPREAAHADRAGTWHAEPGTSSSLRHLRSAWDIAGSGPVAAAVARAQPPVRRRTGSPRSPRSFS